MPEAKPVLVRAASRYRVILADPASGADIGPSSAVTTTPDPDGHRQPTAGDAYDCRANRSVRAPTTSVR